MTNGDNMSDKKKKYEIMTSTIVYSDDDTSVLI